MKLLASTQGGNQLELYQAEHQPLTYYGPGQSAEHSDQLELDLHWPGVPRMDELGRVSQVDIEMTARLVTAVVEALGGRRPLAQLQSRLHPRVYAAMQTRVRLGLRPTHAMRVRSLHAFQPAEGVIEAAATLERADRAAALAARLQRTRPGWLCTVLRVL